jgi:hypothetical protein
MRQIKYGLMGVSALLVIGLTWLVNLPTVVSQSTVQLKTEPSWEQVIPNETLVKFKLQGLNAASEKLSNAKFQVHIFTPPKTPWFTSDFPLVEGKSLLDFEAITTDGTLEFEQLLPIRGTYTMEVMVKPQVTEAFESFKQSLTFSVPENPVKYSNFAILVLILLLVGLGSGWVLGGEQRIGEGEVAPQPVRLLLSGMMIVAIAVLLTVNVSAEMNSAKHEHSGTHEHGKVMSKYSIRENTEEIQLELLGNTQAVVGQLTSQEVKITNPVTKQPITDVSVSVKSVVLENDALIFSYQGIPDTTGKITWSEQFFDGTPHQLTATVSPLENSSQSFKPLQVAQEIEVKAIAPPLFIRLISLFYFTLILIVGLILGLWGKRNNLKLN